jgi:hypothetical protein
MRFAYRLAFLAIVGIIALPVGCSDDDSGKSILEPNTLPENAAPDFSILDINPDSPRYDEMVSPRDYVGQISAYYFGHAT